MKNLETILRKRAVVVVQLAALVALASCGGEEPQGPPYITKVTPTTSAAGSTLTIEGHNFDDVNDVGFELPPSPDTFKAGFSTGVPASGGTEIEIEPDDVLGACPMTQVTDENEACPDIGINLPLGDTKIFVVTRLGESNHVPIHLSPP